MTNGDWLFNPSILDPFIDSGPISTIELSRYGCSVGSFASKPYLSIEEISSNPYIDRLFCETRDALLSETKIKKLNLFAHYRSQRDDFIQEWVAQGFGLAIMPKHSVSHPDVITIPYQHPSPKRNIHIIYNHTDHNPIRDQIIPLFSTIN